MDLSIRASTNEMLKKMWAIQQKLVDGHTIDSTEVEYYNTNLVLIKKYYTEQYFYWQERKPLVDKTTSV